MDMREPEDRTGAAQAPPVAETRAERAASDPAKRIVARKVAVLVARGKSTAEIATELDLSIDRVRTLKKSPLFQEMVAIIEEKITDEGVSSVVQSLIDDAPTNMKFIREVRDGHAGDDAKLLGVRLRAATYLGDKVLPNASGAADAADRVINVILGAGLMAQMARGMKNDGAVIDTVALPAPAAKGAVMSPEEFERKFYGEQIAQEMRDRADALEDEDDDA